MVKDIFINNQKIKLNKEESSGIYVKIDGEDFYKITNYDKMNPFFMSIVSNSDHWMFVSSRGSLTAGRRNPDNALFPYYTDDKIHDSADYTGSKTIFRIKSDQGFHLWEPFSDRYLNVYQIKRNIYKNIPGNKLIFEEINLDLGLTFSYSWLNSEKYGFIKKSVLTNNNSSINDIEVLDGIQNILPFGIDQKFQNEYSTLADGYKRSELIKEFGIGIFSLSSIPSDKAEPSESLKATTVWSYGLKAGNYLLSSIQLDNFRKGFDLINEDDIKGNRGAYFINSEIKLNSGEKKDWIFTAEINQDSSDLAFLCNEIKSNSSLKDDVLKNVQEGTETLIKLVGTADGLQLSSDKLVTSRHFANTLFNIMRGGIFDNSYEIDRNDFLEFIKTINSTLYDKYKEKIYTLEEKVFLNDLFFFVSEINDNQLNRITNEYLPLTFSRRHGDPSRPWNRFSIELKDKKNNKILNYQGNWRDIFQNWEALAESHPCYIESMITKFLNGSTVDGYNPYRVTRDGFEWEAPEPDQPWANIGYWGDHQIIYLLKLLEFSVNHNSEKILSILNKETFTYLNDPYRIKNYENLLHDPHDTIDYDFKLDQQIHNLCEKLGADGKNILTKEYIPYQVNLIEKLIVPLLSKLSNFIPGGGIWMNTQRPEWNDANNALVGYGVSMVTLYYMRRYVDFMINIFNTDEVKGTEISEEVKDFFDQLNKVFQSNVDLLKNQLSDKQRKSILDGLGKAGSEFRQKIYSEGLSFNKENISIDELIDFLSVVQKYIEHTIDANKREDGLYHSYNLMSVKDDEIQITYLYEMLEGQVAVLSSGYLNSDQTLELLKSLRQSSLYREDQNSYILYPNRDLTKFKDKNIIPASDVESTKLLMELINKNNSDVISKDVLGNYHFNGEIKNSAVLKEKLKKAFDQEGINIIESEVKKVLDIYESIFNHKSFTGRSGTFYKYEGLGSIYWHMVSKLALAVQESFISSLNKDDESNLKKINSFYYEIKEGIGVHKSPADYGAFPTDPYSHTPSFTGVQQPGMTGQVKEDVISRFGELGIIVINGEINFQNNLLNEIEFTSVPETFNFYNVNGIKDSIQLPIGSIAFTYCQVPVVYHKSDKNKIIINTKEETLEINEMKISKELSNDIFWKNDNVKSIKVYFNYHS
jgi:hypothetical protein